MNDTREEEDNEPFEPDWRLTPPGALATILRIALHRRGVKWGDTLETDEQWEEMCGEIIDQMEPMVVCLR